MIYTGNQAEYIPFATTEGAYGKVATASTGGLAVVEAYIQNRSGDSQAVGLATKLQESDVKVVRYGNHTANIIDTDITEELYDGTTCTVFPDTAGVGVVIGAKVPFGIVLPTVVTGAAGTTKGFIVTYFNGTTQTDFAPTFQEPDTFQVGTVDTNLVAFQPPTDWAKGQTAAVDPNDMMDDYYCLRIVCSAACDLSHTWSGISVGRVLFGQGSVLDDDYLSVNPREDIKLREGEGLYYYHQSATCDCLGTVGFKRIATP